jgi:hypothetical protein
MCTKVTDNSALKVVVFLIKHKNYVTVVLRNRCEFWNCLKNLFAMLNFFHIIHNNVWNMSRNKRGAFYARYVWI